MMNIKLTDVLHIKNFLTKNAFAVSPKDKNIGQLRIECQFRILDRLKNEIYNCPSFEKCLITHSEVLAKWKTIFISKNLGRFGYKHTGRVPDNYTLNKKILLIKLD